jgi:uncharacterized membrane protein YhaH (DUF805 family)
MNWMFLPLRRYFDIFGRSQRREYWLFFLMLWAVDAVIVTIFGSGTYSMAGGVSHHASVTGSLLGAIFTFTPDPQLAVTGAAVA